MGFSFYVLLLIVLADFVKCIDLVDKKRFFWVPNEVKFTSFEINKRVLELNSFSGFLSDVILLIVYY
jgi:hypothetical protein